MAVRRRLRRVVAIDWDVRSLHIALATISKRASRSSACSARKSRRGDPGPSGADGAAHSRRTQQEGVHARSAIVAIPRDQAILKTLRVPRRGRLTCRGSLGFRSPRSFHSRPRRQ